MWEDTRFLVSNENFFWLETCKLLDTFVNISGDEVLVATMEFGVGFLDEGNPEFVWVFAVTEDWLVLLLSFLGVDWNTLVDDNVDP